MDFPPQDHLIEDFNDDSENFSDDDENCKGPLDGGFEVAVGHAGNAMLDAANFGLSTHAIAETNRRERGGEEYDGATAHYGPSSAPPPSQPKTLQQKIQEPLLKTAPFKVTAKIAEQGRKAITEKLATEETYKKQILVDKINKYYELWPELKEDAPKKGKFSTSDSMKILELELGRCIRTKGRRKTLEKVKKADLLFSWGLEKIVGAFGVDARGLAYEAKRSQDMIEEELKELAMEYGDWFNTSIEFDYTMIKLQMLFAVIERNKAYALKGIMAEGTLDPEQQEALHKKYNDL